MLKPLILGIILSTSCVGLAAANEANKNECSKQNITKIENAIDNYLVKHSTLKFEQFEVLVKRCVGDYALFRLHPKKAETDDAFVFLNLNKKDKTWEVMAMGTDFESSLLEKLPKELRDFSTMKK